MIKFAEGYNPEHWPQEPEMQLRAHCLKRDDMRRNLVEVRKAMDAFLDATAIEWERNEAYREDAMIYAPAPSPDAPAYLLDVPVPPPDDPEVSQPLVPSTDRYWGNASKKERRRQRLEAERRHRKQTV